MMTVGRDVRLGAIHKISGMFHDPSTLIGPLPLIDWHSSIDVDIINIAQAKLIKGNLHVSSVADLAICRDQFGGHGKHSGYDLGTGLCHLLMFQLGAIGRS